MGGMISTVAKAIYEKRNGPGCVPWSQRDAAHKAPYLADARAAIDALREPTREMMTAIGYPTYTDGWEQWGAMIDAALTPIDARQ